MPDFIPHETNQVQTFHESSYNGPQLKDFIRRLNALYETAKSVAKKDDLVLLAELAATYQDTLQDLRIDCDIEAIPLDQLLEKEALLVKKIQQAKKHLSAFLQHVTPLLYPEEQSIRRQLKAFEKAEAAWTRTQKRPNFVNLYPSSDPSIQRVSAQETLGEAIPSTCRSEKRLSNFARIELGFKDSKGIYTPQFEGYRHGSYPSIGFKSKKERTEGADEAVKDLLREILRRKIKNAKAKGETLDNPISLSLASLSLLTPRMMPVPFLRTDTFIGQASEYQQMEESYEALNKAKTIQTLEVDGITYNIKPDILFMNSPSNSHGVMTSKYNPSPLETQLNQEGMKALINDAEAFIKDFKVLKTIKELSRLELETKQQEISKALETEVDPKQRVELEFLQLYLQAKALYDDGEGNFFEFGARYVLLNQRMGKAVDFFCKSGEDRTGRLQNFLEELCEFLREKKRFPNYDFATKKIMREDYTLQAALRKKAATFSVSKDICDANAHGARDLQPVGQLANRITTDPINDGLPNKAAYALAKLAKGVYSPPRKSLKKNPLDIKISLQGDPHQPMNATHAVGDNGLGFTESFIKKNTSLPPLKAPQSRTQARATISHRGTYEGVDLKEGDGIHAQKIYTSTQHPPITGHVLHELHEDTHVFSDSTQDPKHQLSEHANRELAFEQAFMLLSHLKKGETHITLKGADPQQIAKVHAALLFLKTAHPSFKTLHIHSTYEKPSTNTYGFFYKNEHAFIEKHLGPTNDTFHQVKKTLQALMHEQERLHDFTQTTQGSAQKNGPPSHH
ncbi:MAG: hypothetical protein ACOYKA_04270 [Legionellaceae bacterium]